ncbi:MAG: hypothetical protein LBT54_03655 [Bifidobacteriaceae bacterium]|jgi:hypothetical protein|nr:hypothetical protein [Bifidobacteriaceae bacterium]
MKSKSVNTVVACGLAVAFGSGGFALPMPVAAGVGRDAAAGIAESGSAGEACHKSGSISCE